MFQIVIIIVIISISIIIIVVEFVAKLPMARPVASRGSPEILKVTSESCEPRELTFYVRVTGYDRAGKERLNMGRKRPGSQVGSWTPPERVSYIYIYIYDVIPSYAACQ